MRKIIALSGLITALAPIGALADPLDTGEAYTTRKGPPDWMSGIDFTWLLVDYIVFAIMVFALGWVLAKRISVFERFETILYWPFTHLFSLASHLPILLRELAQGIIGLAILFLVVAWVFFCQWLSQQGLGAISMAGLALEAVVFIRVVKQAGKPSRISRP